MDTSGIAVLSGKLSVNELVVKISQNFLEFSGTQKLNGIVWNIHETLL